MTDETSNSDDTIRRLSDMQPGESGLVRAIDSKNPALKKKLLIMGIVAGTAVTVEHVAPLGDPVAITALGYKLSLRKSEAVHVSVAVHPNLDQPEPKRDRRAV